MADPPRPTPGVAPPPGPRTSTQSRFARRRWLARVGRFRRQILLVLGVGVLVAAAWLVYVSSVFGVRAVQVEGVGLLSAQEVRDAAGVRPGTALASLDTEEVAERVGALTPVDSVTVSRDWPHDVRIVVAEREAVAAVRQDGRVSGMDADGVLFRAYDRAPRRLPLVDAEQLEDLGREEALREAAVVVAALAPPIARRVATVEVSSQDDITLVLADDDRVTWGSADDSDLKAEVLDSLLGQPASVYDVSVPAQPTTLQ